MSLAADTATTGQKTHRYLRLSLVFVVFALLVSVAIETVVVSWEPFTLGWDPLPSLSHYFYTSARSVFVGSLIAASLALLALSGRNRATVLLDISAIFAPLIALIPTGIDADRPVDGLTCPGDAECIPDPYLGDVRAGVVAYVIVVLTVVVAMAVIRRTKRIRVPGAVLVSTIAVVTAVVLAVLAFVPALNADFPFNFWPFPSSIHFLVTLLFFGSFAAVPVLMSREPLDEGETPPTERQKTIYRWITRLMIADLLLLVAAFVLRDQLRGFPVVLVGEVIALCLFAWFWWVQTFQRWEDEDPPGLAVDLTPAEPVPADPAP
jgi:hypothetical protein